MTIALSPIHTCNLYSSFRVMKDPVSLFIHRKESILCMTVIKQWLKGVEWRKGKKIFDHLDRQSRLQLVSKWY